MALVDLAGSVALVTGASRGVGRAVALRLAAAGADVVAVARGRAGLEEVAAEARSTGLAGAIRPAPADVRDRTAVRRVVAEVETVHGRIDVLVNNAGVERVRPLADLSDEDEAAMVDTNFLGVVNCLRAVVPGMQRRRRGHVVTVSSMAGLRGFADDAVYCGTKFAVVGLMEALDEELRPHGIRVSTICPGAIDTELVKWVADDDPVRRWFLVPDDVAEAVLYAVRQPSRVAVGLIAVRPICEPPHAPMLPLETLETIYPEPAG